MTTLTDSTSPRTAPAASPDGIKLHIGGREKRDGWIILDALPGPAVDYVGNCTDLSFLPEGSCSEVYASHVLEHLGYDIELPRTLAGIHRVLKPGGRLRAAVPDLDILCRLFVDPALDGDGRFHVMRMMFGGRTTPYDVHYAGLNFEFFQAFLQEIGFRDVRRVEDFGLFEDTSTLLFGNVPISLNVEARK
jgi:predicted SAM-dependent methyltransferase